MTPLTYINIMLYEIKTEKACFDMREGGERESETETDRQTQRERQTE